MSTGKVNVGAAFFPVHWQCFEDLKVSYAMRHSKCLNGIRFISPLDNYCLPMLIIAINVTCYRGRFTIAQCWSFSTCSILHFVRYVMLYSTDDDSHEDTIPYRTKTPRVTSYMRYPISYSCHVRPTDFPFI
jgi:hypothetical protein